MTVHDIKMKIPADAFHLSDILRKMTEVCRQYGRRKLMIELIQTLSLRYFLLE